MIFKRPDTTQRVFEAIAQARPRQLFVVADGPRHPGEAPLCAAARAIVQAVDWECDVRTNFAETNLGLKRRIASGLDWVFEQVEQAIILEDDCLPDPSFLPFCAELLDRYRDDERIAHISGDNFLSGPRVSTASYIFTRYIYVWGWATWRRAWRKFDREMALWDDAAVRARVLDQFPDPKERRFWAAIWQQVRTGTISTWDYPWAYACRASGGLGVIPSTNLVTNVGFGAAATHTVVETGFGAVARRSLAFPLVHPPAVAVDETAERELGRLVLVRAPLYRRAIRRVKRILTGLKP